MTFGQRIRELRRARGMNQRELASHAEIDVTYLSKIENDRMSPPSEETIRKMTAVLRDANAADAEELDDELLVLAGRVPEDIEAIVTKSPERPAFFRSVADLTDDELRELRKQAEAIRDKRSS